MLNRSYVSGKESISYFFISISISSIAISSIVVCIFCELVVVFGFRDCNGIKCILQSSTEEAQTFVLDTACGNLSSESIAGRPLAPERDRAPPTFLRGSAPSSEAGSVLFIALSISLSV